MVDLDDFTSYHLGLIIAALEAEMAARPEAPASHAIRAAAIDYLPWDQRFRDCWSDPNFQHRYAWLREQLNLNAYPTIRDVLPTLRAWLVKLDPPAPDPEPAPPAYDPSELI